MSMFLQTYITATEWYDLNLQERCGFWFAPLYVGGVISRCVRTLAAVWISTLLAQVLVKKVKKS